MKIEEFLASGEQSGHQKNKNMDRYKGLCTGMSSAALFAMMES